MCLKSRPVLLHSGSSSSPPKCSGAWGCKGDCRQGVGWGESLTPVVLTPDLHGALEDAAAGGGQGQADEQQPQEADHTQLHPQHLQAAVTRL